MTAEEVLIPAGFNDGSNVGLRLPGGQYTGSLHVSFGSAAAYTDERRDLIEQFSPPDRGRDVLRRPQRVVDALAPDAFALLVSATGVAIELPDGRQAPT